MGDTVSKKPTLKTETDRLLDEMDRESKAYKPPLGLGFIKTWLTKTIWLFKAFNQRISALEEGKH